MSIFHWLGVNSNWRFSLDSCTENLFQYFLECSVTFFSNKVPRFGTPSIGYSLLLYVLLLIFVVVDIFSIILVVAIISGFIVVNTCLYVMNNISAIHEHKILCYFLLKV